MTSIYEEPVRYNFANLHQYEMVSFVELITQCSMIGSVHVIEIDNVNLWRFIFHTSENQLTVELSYEGILENQVVFERHHRATTPTHIATYLDGWIGDIASLR